MSQNVFNAEVAQADASSDVIDAHALVNFLLRTFSDGQDLWHALLSMMEHIPRSIGFKSGEEDGHKSLSWNFKNMSWHKIWTYLALFVELEDKATIWILLLHPQQHFLGQWARIDSPVNPQPLLMKITRFSPLTLVILALNYWRVTFASWSWYRAHWRCRSCPCPRSSHFGCHTMSNREVNLEFSSNILGTSRKKCEI